ncbi:MAG: NAD(P)-dependent oxidoreductase [Eubacteriales bacterium]|nr:NAD(P)-dependent oxidoreductase [Eubacteriales bacterium]
MKIVILNGAKVNYDGIIDYSVLAGAEDQLVVFDKCEDHGYREISEGAEVIISKELPISRDDIMDLPDSVRLICEAGTGYNNIDLDACRERGIGVCNVPSYSSERVAHTAVMLMLMLASTMQTQISMLAKGDHTNFDKCLSVPHVELNGKTLGVVGAGNIGRQTIAVGRALGMNVLVYNRTKREDSEGVHFTTLEDVFRNSDFISLHCPLNEATKHLVNRETLSMMKPGAFLVNTARGGLVKEEDLIEALREKKIAGAGLDVQEVEPLSADSPLFELDNVIVTPHMGWKGLETRQRLVSILKDGIDGYRRGERINRVD